MALFRYEAFDEAGELAAGTIEAPTGEAAELAIGAKGLTVFRLNAWVDAEQSWWRRELFSTAKAGRNLASFTRELSVLYAAGLPLDDCLRIMGDEASTEGIRSISSPLLSSVLDGAALADAMEKSMTKFSSEYLSIVRAGEISGRLAEALHEISDLLERRAAISASVQSALIYPAILLGLAAVSIGIVIGILVPSIAPVFAESGKPVPAALGFLIAMRENGASLVAIIVGLVVSALAWHVYVQRSPARRMVFDGYTSQLPILGSFIVQTEVARFSRTLGVLLNAGVPLLQALSSGFASIGNQLISSKVERAITRVSEGRSLSGALSDENVFPAVAVRMIAVGEESAKLGGMLLRVADMFEGRNQKRIEIFMSVLTPALTLAIATGVGGLVLIVMNAILSMNELAVGQ